MVRVINPVPPAQSRFQGTFDLINQALRQRASQRAAQQLQDQRIQEQRERNLASIAQSLASLPSAEARSDFLVTIRPILERLGLTEDDLGQLFPADETQQAVPAPGTPAVPAGADTTEGAPTGASVTAAPEIAPGGVPPVVTDPRARRPDEVIRLRQQTAEAGLAEQRLSAAQLALGTHMATNFRNPDGSILTPQQGLSLAEGFRETGTIPDQFAATSPEFVKNEQQFLAALGSEGTVDVPVTDPQDPTKVIIRKMGARELATLATVGDTPQLGLRLATGVSNLDYIKALTNQANSQATLNRLKDLLEGKQDVEAITAQATEITQLQTDATGPLLGRYTIELAVPDPERPGRTTRKPVVVSGFDLLNITQTQTDPDVIRALLATNLGGNTGAQIVNVSGFAIDDSGKQIEGLFKSANDEDNIRELLARLGQAGNKLAGIAPLVANMAQRDLAAAASLMDANPLAWAIARQHMPPALSTTLARVLNDPTALGSTATRAFSADPGTIAAIIQSGGEDLVNLLKSVNLTAEDLADFNEISTVISGVLDRAASAGAGDVTLPTDIVERFFTLLQSTAESQQTLQERLTESGALTPQGVPAGTVTGETFVPPTDDEVDEARRRLEELRERQRLETQLGRSGGATLTSTRQ